MQRRVWSRILIVAGCLLLVFLAWLRIRHHRQMAPGANIFATYEPAEKRFGRRVGKPRWLPPGTELRQVVVATPEVRGEWPFSRPALKIHHDGLRLRYDRRTKTFFVWAVYPGSPADRAGIRLGWEVVAIDGVPTHVLSREWWSKRMQEGEQRFRGARIPRTTRYTFNTETGRRTIALSAEEITVPSSDALLALMKQPFVDATYARGDRVFRLTIQPLGYRMVDEPARDARPIRRGNWLGWLSGESGGKCHLTWYSGGCDYTLYSYQGGFSHDELIKIATSVSLQP